jgi:outer membrane protein OmpA-like peptidoglycan-associated protein
MSTQDEDSQQRLALGLVFGLVAVVVAVVVGASAYRSMKAPTAPKTAAAATATTALANEAANAAQNAMDAASVKVENGVVKFYFASGKSELAAGANAALTDVIKGAQGGRRLVVSGYHDATGSAAQNQELARQRALAVRDALKAAGVADDRIELKKPEMLTAAGSDAAARRVEVALQ